jgi:hydrogenase maturation protease
MESEENQHRPILILGIGNILLKDEGIGVRVVQAMQKMELPPDVEICDGGTGGADLLDIIAHRRKLIIIDAADADVEPGTVIKMGANDLAQNKESISLHEFGLAETLFAAAQLKCSPKEVVIFGVKPFEVAYGIELTPPIAALVPRLVNLVLAEANIETKI